MPMFSKNILSLKNIEKVKCTKKTLTNQELENVLTKFETISYQSLKIKLAWLALFLKKDVILLLVFSSRFLQTYAYFKVKFVLTLKCQYHNVEAISHPFEDLQNWPVFKKVDFNPSANILHCPDLHKW